MARLPDINEWANVASKKLMERFKADFLNAYGVPVEKVANAVQCAEDDSSQGMTADEIGQLIDHLRNFTINLCELKDIYYGDVHFHPAICSDAADALEDLAANNKSLFEFYEESFNQFATDRDYWKARCEAAEKDMKTLADTRRWLDSELPCSLCVKYRTLCPKRDACFQWRGVQEKDNDE